MPTPVRIDLDFFPGVEARRPVVLVGQALRLHIGFRDEDGTLLPVPSGRLLTLRRPDGNTVELPDSAWVLDDDGRYHADVTPDVAGAWGVRVATTSPGPAAVERSFAVESSQVVPPDPDAILVTEDLAPVVTQAGEPLRAKRIPQLPQAVSIAGLMLVGARDDEAVHVPAIELGDLYSGPPVVQTGAASGTEALEFEGLEAAYDLTLTGDCAFSFAAAAAGRAQRLHLLLRQGDEAGHLPSFPATVLWPGGVAPTLNSAAGRMDYFRFVSLGGATVICELQVRLRDPLQASASYLLLAGGGQLMLMGGGSLQLVGAP